jgi:hypothetical protein
MLRLLGYKQVRKEQLLSFGEKRDISLFQSYLVCHKITKVIRSRICSIHPGFLKGRSTVINLIEFFKFSQSGMSR